jgi:phosphatidylglycerophosphate synthase
MRIFMRRQRRVSLAGNSRDTPFVNQANLLTGTRLLLIPVLWTAALLGSGRIVGLGLLAAGATDFLDGYVARRLGQDSPAGARLDAIADNLLLLSALAWMELLHPEILSENATLIAVALGLYFASLPGGRLHSFSSKLAGGALYSFAVITLLTGGYEPLLLRLAMAAFILSSVETLLVQASHTIHDIGSARKHRSHAPQAEKVVGSRINPRSSTPTSATPNASEILP